MQSLQAFYGAVVIKRRRPTFTWTLSPDGKTIVAGNFSIRPEAVVVWQSTTTDGWRDWRLFSCRTSKYGAHCRGTAGGLGPIVGLGADDSAIGLTQPGTSRGN